jgi:hypothetical protein
MIVKMKIMLLKTIAFDYEINTVVVVRKK